MNNVLSDFLKKAAESGKVYISMQQRIDWVPICYIESMGNEIIAFRYENDPETIITNLNTIAIKVID